MKAVVGRHAAREVQAELASYCKRIEVAGSVRRGSPEPHDVELVYIPHTLERSRQLSLDLETVGQVPERPPYDLAEARIKRLVELGFWSFDTEVPRNGPKYKRLVREVEDPNWWEHKWEEAARVVIELYRADRVNWGYILALRTGPVEFNKLLVTRKKKGGAMPEHLWVDRGYLRAVRAEPMKGDVVPVAEEVDFFRHLDLPHWAPEDRTREILVRYLKDAGGG